VYLQPYEQTIVGDGDRLWIYDKDLNQVTVRKLGNALGQTPAAILSGTNDLEKSFSLKDGGARDGIEWVEATPKARDTQFEKVRIGFSPQGMLSSMELTDAFGQVSRLSFGALERGVRFPAEHFRFTPPTGADVMSDSK
jgi:outer membrane lipoprotein carrier protein